jgi:hypothetical protein
LAISRRCLRSPRPSKKQSGRNPRGGESASGSAGSRTLRRDVVDFAVTQSWQRPELVEAVRTLLSLGADPNHTNGSRNSFAMANAAHASAPVLRAMLEAAGNANARNPFGGPMILKTWYLGYFLDQARSRFELLLDHGADVNSAMPDKASDSTGYTVLLYRTKMGLDDKLAYADALTLLERGADPNRAGADGMTFEKMLKDHRAHFGPTPPAEFGAFQVSRRARTRFRRLVVFARNEPRVLADDDEIRVVGKSPGRVGRPARQVLAREHMRDRRIGGFARADHRDAAVAQEDGGRAHAHAGKAYEVRFAEWKCGHFDGAENPEPSGSSNQGGRGERPRYASAPRNKEWRFVLKRPRALEPSRPDA